MPQAVTDAQSALRMVYTTYPGLAEEQPMLESATQVMDYGPGEPLFQRGTPVTAVYLLLSGSVEETGLKRLADGSRRRHLARSVTAPRPQA